MTDEFLSAEQVAELLGLHVRTVRSWLREGKLKAVRLGKQYRIARADLDALTGSKPLPVETPTRSRQVEVSSVVQIDALSPSAASRLMTALTASTGGAHGEPGKHVSCQYNESIGRLKVIMSGGLNSTTGLLQLIQLLLEQ